MKLVEQQAAILQRRQHNLFDDFLWYVSAHLWTSVLTDSGTITVGDAAGGIAAIAASDGSVADNDEGYLKTTNELFKIADDKPLTFETRIQFTEANTDDANVCVGLMDAVAANSILDNGGGPKASYSGAVFFKTDGGTVWNVESSNAGTQSTSATAITAGGAAYQTLRIEIRPVTTSNAEVTFFVDGVQCKDATSNLPIKHNLSLTSLTEMNAFAGVKNGDTNMETLNVDYIGVSQLR